MSVKRRSTPSRFTATCALLGDGGVGKTSLLLAHLLGKFINDYLPGPVDWHAEFDHVTKQPIILQRDGVDVEIKMIDTVGLDEYQKLRQLVCAQADVFCLCFDVTSPVTLEHVKEHWIDEVRVYSKEAPFILVGTKTDERRIVGKDGRLNKEVVHTNQGEEAAQLLKAFSYVECSAKDLTGLKTVFEHAALAYLEKGVLPGSNHRKSCVVS